MSVTYQQIPQRRHKVRYDSTNADNLLVWEPVDDEGSVITISGSVAWETFDTGGTTIETGTEAPTNNVIKLALDTTTEANYPVGSGYRIKFTVNTDEHIGNQYFDVVKHLLRIYVTRDQLQDEDQRVQSMDWAADEELLGPIKAARDDLQFDIEAHVIEGGRLLENMILDDARMGVPMKFLALHKVFKGHSMEEAAEYYAARYDRTLRAALATIEFDTSGDQVESDTMGGIQEIKIIP